MVEFSFVIDFVANFLTVPPSMRIPKPRIKHIAVAYLKSYFIFDSIALLSNILYVIPRERFLIWSLRLKLFRSFRLNYMHECYSSIINAFTYNNPKQRRLIEKYISLIYGALYLVHYATCIWIKLGSRDFN